MLEMLKIYRDELQPLLFHENFFFLFFKSSRFCLKDCRSYKPQFINQDLLRQKIVHYLMKEINLSSHCEVFFILFFVNLTPWCLLENKHNHQMLHQWLPTYLHLILRSFVIFSLCTPHSRWSYKQPPCLYSLILSG